MNCIFTQLELMKNDSKSLLRVFSDIDFSDDEEFNALCSFLDKEKKIISKLAIKASLYNVVYNS